jgi:hypothetical protein
LDGEAVMALEPGARDKLIKLIRLLSSDKEGERLGAVAAIERTLHGAGLSFHDLAETISDQIIEVVKEKVVVKIVEIDRTQRDWIEYSEKLLQVDTLEAHERKFVQDMKQRAKLKPNFEPSQKQANWFADLCLRHIKGLRESKSKRA